MQATARYQTLLNGDRMDARETLLRSDTRQVFCSSTNRRIDAGRSLFFIATVSIHQPSEDARARHRFGRKS